MWKGNGFSILYGNLVKKSASQILGKMTQWSLGSGGKINMVVAESRK